LLEDNASISSSETSSGADDGGESSEPQTSSEETFEASLGLENTKSKKHIGDAVRPARKRKRSDAEDDLEGKYLNRLAKEEAREQQHLSSNSQIKRRKTRGLETFGNGDASSNSDGESGTGDTDIITGDQKDDVPKDIPLHESMIESKNDLDLEKSSRTVFLANVATSAIKSKSAKKVLLDHLTSFTASLPASDRKHSLESLRFRSTAFASSALPKKAAFARKDLMDTTTKSTNAYAVYTTSLAAREASKKLNGSMALDRHLRVDSVAHPAKIDHRRCVFVGNLGFVDDMTNINAAEDEENQKSPRKAKEPADVEEGLWRQFGKAGAIESVRVVRDKTTRVGKGFAYVQFEDANSVEKALLYNEKKFPPMLPRILRVTRAKNVKKAAAQKENKTQFKPKRGSSASYNPKVPSNIQSLSGRAGKLLGRAGAARIKASGDKGDHPSKVNGIAKSPESIVFEGYRASRQQGKGALKMGGSGKAQGKPRTRSSRRGAEFKAKGKKKART